MRTLLKVLISTSLKPQWLSQVAKMKRRTENASSAWTRRMKDLVDRRVITLTLRLLTIELSKKN